MDIVKFASFVSYLTSMYGAVISETSIEAIKNRLEDMQEPIKASQADVDTLLAEMNNPAGIIPAIKAYRVLTRAGLKEAKDAVEKHRNPVAM